MHNLSLGRTLNSRFVFRVRTVQLSIKLFVYPSFPSYRLLVLQSFQNTNSLLNIEILVFITSVNNGSKLDLFINLEFTRDILLLVLNGVAMSIKDWIRFETSLSREL
jgi:hypothetical protein